MKLFLSSLLGRITAFVRGHHIHHTWVRKYTLLVLISLVALAALSGAYIYRETKKTASPTIIYNTQEERDDIYTRFLMEAYDSVKKNYFAKMTDEEYLQLFQLSIQKVHGGTGEALATSTRQALATYVESTLATVPQEKRKQFVLDTLTVALYNLQPVGRNGVLTNKQETALRQNVSNINTNKDLYKDLGVEKGSPVEKVQEAFKAKEAVLVKQDTLEAKEELKKITYAKKVLTDESNKKMYDESQIEPTVAGTVIGSTLYLAVNKISPTTLREFGIIVSRASTTPNINSMILDFRGNIGGALDFTKYFLGAFIGRNQVAFDLFHQDEFEAQRTVLDKFDPLFRYKDIAIFTDNMTQSTAEVTTAAFKRFRLATVIGTPTRGWGTVENTYPLTTVLTEGETYALFLVNSITLDENNVPIEGRGVMPHILTTSATYKDEIRSLITNTSLRKAVLERIVAEPLR